MSEEPTPDTKMWYKSKTLWFNVLVAVVTIGTVLADPSIISDPQVVAVATVVVTVVNALLRVFFTTSSLQIRR